MVVMTLVGPDYFSSMAYTTFSVSTDGKRKLQSLMHGCSKQWTNDYQGMSAKIWQYLYLG